MSIFSPLRCCSRVNGKIGKHGVSTTSRFQRVSRSFGSPSRRYITTGLPPIGRSNTYRRLAIFGVTLGLTMALLPSKAEAEGILTTSSGLEGIETTPRGLINLNNSLTSAPTTQLLRSYLVYTACAFPTMIDHAPNLLHAFTHSYIPGLKAITEGLVRYTFFAQFVPGETVGDCMASMIDLRKRNIGSVLNYSAEAECESLQDVKRIQEARLREVYLAIEKSKEFEDGVAEEGGMRGSTAFALKITGLIDPDILARASVTILRLRQVSASNSPSSPLSPNNVSYPGTPQHSDYRVIARNALEDSKLLGADGRDGQVLLSLKGGVAGAVLDKDQGLRAGDLEELKTLWSKLKDLGEFAKDKGVTLMIDAEHTYYQPALDAYSLLLSERLNRPPKDKKEKWAGPVIYGTYQSYLTRQPQHLLAAIKQAEESGYALGIKLVRGAYFVQERKRWREDGRDGPDPIWPDKPSTDKCYNTAVSTILTTLSRQLSSPDPRIALSVAFGTHNPESCETIIKNLEKNGLASRVDKKSDVSRLRDDVRGKVFIAQLYGMKDDLTDMVAGRFEPNGMPVALKYIAYGSLSEVMPFLGRRAIENKSLMTGEGGAAAERKRLSKELWRRIFG